VGAFFVLAEGDGGKPPGYPILNDVAYSFGLKGYYGKGGGLSLEDHLAECFGFRGEGEDIARSVTCSQFLA